MTRKVPGKIDILAIGILLVVSSIVVFSWFRNGNFYGGGEESLSVWNSFRMLNTYRFGWLDIGLGYSSPFWLPRIPLYLFTYFLELFLSPVIAQAILFWILMLAAGIGMYFLAKLFFGDREKWIPLLAGLFYVLNLYVQSQVWARFIFAGLFNWASLPLLLFLWIKWLSEGKYKFLFGFGLCSILFSSAYSHPAFILSFWLVSGLYSSFKIFLNKFRKADRRVYLSRIVLGFLTWTVFNIWWIYPYFILQQQVASNLHDWKYDFANLMGVSVDSKVGDVLLLRHKFFFERLDYWGNFYKTPFAYFVSLMILVITLLGAIKAKVLKEYKYLLSLAIIGIFICKGTNPPFGNTLFKLLFEYIPLARVFRSSYEKFGTVWLMVYSLFFAYGVGYIYGKGSKILKVALTIFLVFTLIILVWPMWRGGPFSPQASISVPSYYSVTEKYLNSLGVKGRTLSLPLIPGEGVKYDWGRSSYYGLEPSDILFPQPVLSRTIRSNVADKKYTELLISLNYKKDINKLLTDTDVEYLILHNEADSKYSGSSTSAEVKETLKKYPEIKFLKSVGSLDVYKNTNFEINTFISLSKGIHYNYHKINPGRYKVEIIEANVPFELRLKNSFNFLWTARIGEEVLHDHFIVYDYANGWRINKNGSYTIDIVFKIWPWE